MTYFDPTQRLTDNVNYKKKTKFTNKEYFDLISGPNFIKIMWYS